jgi:hypothetical protein
MTSAQRELLQDVTIISKMHKTKDPTGCFSVQRIAQIKKFYKVFSIKKCIVEGQNIKIFFFHLTTITECLMMLCGTPLKFRISVTCFKGTNFGLK